jgi:hypothetical protein
MKRIYKMFVNILICDKYYMKVNKNQSDAV